MDFFRVRARKFFGFRHGPASSSLPSRLPEHKALLQPVARAPELHEPAVVHDAVDDRRREPVVREDGAPPAGLDVGGGYDAPPPVALGYHLVEQPRPVHVEGHVAELVQDQEPRLGHVGEQPVRRAIGAMGRLHGKGRSGMASPSARMVESANGGDGDLLSWVARYEDEGSCEEALLCLRFPGGWVCPRCGTIIFSQVWLSVLSVDFFRVRARDFFVFRHGQTRALPACPSPLERHPAVDAVGFRPDLDQHLDALPAAVRRLRTDEDFASRQVVKVTRIPVLSRRMPWRRRRGGRLGRCPSLARGRGCDTLLGWTASAFTLFSHVPLPGAPLLNGDKVDLWLGESTPSLSAAKRMVLHPSYRSLIRNALSLVKPDFRLHTKLPRVSLRCALSCG